MRAVIIIGGPSFWDVLTAIGTIGATITALLAIHQARQHHRDDLRAQSVPALTVDCAEMVPDGLVVDLRNVGVGTAISGQFQAWVTEDTPDSGPEETKRRAAVRSGAATPDLVADLPDTGPDQLRAGLMFLRPGGPWTPTSGWVHWETDCRSALGEAIQTSGDITLGGAERVRNVLFGLDVAGIEQRHDLDAEGNDGDRLRLQLGVELSNQHPLGEPIEYRVLTLGLRTDAQIAEDTAWAFDSRGQFVFRNQPRVFFTPVMQLRVPSWPLLAELEIKMHARVATDAALTAEVIRRVAVTLSRPTDTNNGHTGMGLVYHYIGEPQNHLVPRAGTWTAGDAPSEDWAIPSGSGG